jgi:hypothetical protein
MNIPQKLLHFQQQSKNILRQAFPHTSMILRLYPNLCEDDIWTIRDRKQLPPTTITRLSAKTGLSDDIFDVSDLFIRHDFDSSKSYYDYLLESYRNAGIDDESLILDIESEVSEGKVFLLHGLMKVWDSSSNELEGIMIEESYDEDPSLNALEGYLVAQKLAFETSLEILEASYKQQWPGWKKLWKQL